MRKVLVFMIAMLAAGLVFVPAAAADPPQPVYGTWLWNSFIEWGKLVGGNAFLSGWESTEGWIETGEKAGWFGDFSGDSYDVFTGVFHKNGVLNARITIYFTGEVLEVPGTLVIELGVVATRSGWEGGSWVIKSGTDGLADLRGEGKWWWSGDPMATYSGKVHWQ